MSDIKSPALLYTKAGMFVVIGVAASTVLILEQPTLRTAALLAMAIWGFCRAYYFAFYVIEHYVDPRFRFAGLMGFLRYLMKRKCEERHVRRE